MPLSSPIAGPSRSVVRTASKFSERETGALDALKFGLGISQAELDNLFEQCDHCSQSFMRSALCVHIKDVEANRESDSQTSEAEDMSNAEDDDDDDTDTSVVGEL